MTNPAHPTSGKWEDDNTRALLWRLLLGVIPRAAPPSEWASEMSKKRDEYRSLKAEHRVDISKVRGRVFSFLHQAGLLGTYRIPIRTEI